MQRDNADVVSSELDYVWTLPSKQHNKQNTVVISDPHLICMSFSVIANYSRLDPSRCSLNLATVAANNFATTVLQQAIYKLPQCMNSMSKMQSSTSKYTAPVTHTFYWNYKSEQENANSSYTKKKQKNKQTSRVASQRIQLTRVTTSDIHTSIPLSSPTNTLIP